MEGREIIYLSLYCHHQNGSCIKMGGDESHFNVSLTVRSKVTGQCPQTRTFLKRKEGRSLTPYRWAKPAHTETAMMMMMMKCCFTSTETVGLLGTGALDNHLDFHTAPEL